jgi:hypothetical protein
VRLRTDERGVTVQVGTVLLFAVFIVLISTYQATVIPQQNEQVEFNHNEQVQGQLQDLRDELHRAAVTRSGGSTSVALGTRYPVRAVFVNPPQPAGTLRTTPAANATVENATATGETGDYWTGSARNFSTRGLVYEPIYNVYQDPPTTIYDNGVLYNQFESTNQSLAKQHLVRGNRISLVALNGSFSQSRSASATVDFEAISPVTRTVTVRNETDNLSVVVPTARPASEWEELLAEELNQSRGDDRYVLDVEDGPRPNTVRVVLEPGVYELELAKVGVGSDVSGVDSHYVTDVRGDNASVSRGGTQQLVVEVRDRFNNPVSGATVNVSDVTNGSVSPRSAETGADGRATFVYDAPDASGTETVTFNISDAPEPREEATLRVHVAPGGGDGGPRGRLSYNEDAVANDGPDDGDVVGGVDFSVTNEYGEAATITDVTVEPVDGNIDVLADRVGGEGKRASELYVDGDASDGYIDYSDVVFDDNTQDGTSLPRRVDIDLDGRSNDGNPVVSSESNATVHLYEFFTDTNDGANVNMSGEEVNVTVRYRLESQLVGETEFTVTPETDGEGGGEGNQTGSEQLSTVAGSTPEGESDTLQFDVENTGDSDVTVSEFNITTPGRQNSGVEQVDTIDRQPGDREVEITGGGTDGWANPDDPPNQAGFATNGTTYSLDTEAVLNGENTATVKMGAFEGGDIRLTYELTEKPENADIAVSLLLSDGSTKRVFFRVTNVNS